jgi:hypothetical protein
MKNTRRRLNFYNKIALYIHSYIQRTSWIARLQYSTVVNLAIGTDIILPMGSAMKLAIVLQLAGVYYQQDSPTYYYIKKGPEKHIVCY